MEFWTFESHAHMHTRKYTRRSQDELRIKSLRWRYVACSDCINVRRCAMYAIIEIHWRNDVDDDDYECKEKCTRIVWNKVNRLSVEPFHRKWATQDNSTGNTNKNNPHSFAGRSLCIHSHIAETDADDNDETNDADSVCCRCIEINLRANENWNAISCAAKHRKGKTGLAISCRADGDTKRVN